MTLKRLPAGFIIPAQPVVASRPPSGGDWVYEIKHDGYRFIVRRDGPTARLYSRNAIDPSPLIIPSAEMEAVNTYFMCVLNGLSL